MSIYSSFVLLIVSCAKTRGKGKVCTRQCISGGHLIAKFRIFSRYATAAFRRFPRRRNRRAEIEILLRKPRKSRLMTGRESKPPFGSPRTDNDGKQWRVRVPVHVLGVQCRTHGALLPSFGCPRLAERRRRRREAP